MKYLHLLGVVVASLAVLALSHLLPDPVQSRAAAVGGVALVLWLSEIVPPFVPTLLLLAVVPLALSGHGEAFQVAGLLKAAADPVVALFFGGFVLGIAASRHGVDTWIAERVVVTAHGRPGRLLALVMLATAGLSMWMSNIAAAALMLAALRPVTAGLPLRSTLRRGLLVGTAFAANLGGMATPIGTGPNLLAVKYSVELGKPVSFVGWMGFAVPLALVLLAGTWWYLHRRMTERALPVTTGDAVLGAGAWGVVAVFTAMVALWLAEPLTGIPAAVVALGGAGVLFLTGLANGREDLAKVDWGTLVLVAGGIVLGHLLERSGLVRDLAASVDWGAFGRPVLLALLATAAALLSALMSNTATATLLIPIALAVIGDPAAVAVVALGCSLGCPFVISTPPNAMAAGEGGLSSTDLLWPGLLLLVIGIALVVAMAQAGLLG
ncbi:transporter [Planctomycetota bacterium]|nr:transporter [Planctomycetota bacterium]